VNIFSRKSRLCPLALNICSTYRCRQINCGLVFFWGISFLLAFTNFSTIPICRIAKVSVFLLEDLFFFWRLAFHSTMKGNLKTGPAVPIMRSLMSCIKTWFPESPGETVQQIIGAQINFRNARIES